MATARGYEQKRATDVTGLCARWQKLISYQSTEATRKLEWSAAVEKSLIGNRYRKRTGAHLGQVALRKAVQGGLLRNCPFQGHLNHTEHIWQGILQQHRII